VNSVFADIFSANEKFNHEFNHQGLIGRARRGLAVVTCMDARIDPLEALGLRIGDAVILRNPGARVTDDVLRALILAVYVLGVERILVMPHTDCKMTKMTDAELHDLIATRYGVDTRDVAFGTIPDQMATLRADLTRIRTSRHLPGRLAVCGALYDVGTGRLAPIEA